MRKIYGGWQVKVRMMTWEDYVLRDQLVSNREVTYGEAVTAKISVSPAEVIQYEVWLSLGQLVTPDGKPLEEGGKYGKVPIDKHTWRYDEAQFISWLQKQTPRLVLAIHKAVLEDNPMLAGDDGDVGEEGNAEE